MKERIKKETLDKTEKKRIPFEVWSESQCSIARFYGGCIINGKHYFLDYDNCKTVEDGENKKYFPDLVEDK